MELFFAQNHSAMTHLPVATAMLAVACAIFASFGARRELARAWAVLSILALAASLPAVASGVAAAKGRFNGEGKPYIQSGVMVTDNPANERIRRHEVLGACGTGIAAVLALLGVGVMRGRNPNKYLVVLLAVTLMLLWAFGAHLGGEELWGPDTFPAFK